MAKQNRTGTYFDPPIDMDLGTNPGPVVFDNLAEFEEWIVKERNFWKSVDSALDTKSLGGVGKAFLKAATQKRWELINIDPDQASISTLLRYYAEGELIHQDSWAGNQVDALIAGGKMKQAASHLNLKFAT